MNLLTELIRGRQPQLLRDGGLTMDDYLGLVNDAAGLSMLRTTYSAEREEAPSGFEGMASGMYGRNSVVFSCMAVRLMVFSEARFQYQRLTGGRPTDLWGDASLSILENPFGPNSTTGDLLARAIADVDTAGNFFGAKRVRTEPGRGAVTRIRRLRPDWVVIVAGSPSDPEATGDSLDAEVLGYIYFEGGYMAGSTGVVLLPDEIVHWAPYPDPIFQWRGMSWLTPLVREVMGDNAATMHKLRFFENAATVNLAVSLPAEAAPDPGKFREWLELFEQKHRGARNAYKTLYLGGGATAQPVGTNMQQMDFKLVQGAGETRIAAAAQVPAIIVGLSEGLQAATYSNYGQAKRRLADGTMRPLWRNFAGSMQSIVPPPPGNRLWYDDRDIPFLAEDKKDEAEVLGRNATAIKALIDAGFLADSVVQAVDSGDLSRLKHSGLFSVQLQPPGAGVPDAASEAGRALYMLLQPHMAAQGQLGAGQQQD